MIRSFFIEAEQSYWESIEFMKIYTIRLTHRKNPV